MKMGETHVVVKVHGPLGHADVEMLADTGSTLTKIDESTAKRLGITPTGSAVVELADGTDRQRGLAEAEVEIMGDRATVRVLIGPDGEEPLLGLTTLESLRLKVNPIKRRLEPAKFIEYSSSLLSPSMLGPGFQSPQFDLMPCGLSAIATEPRAGRDGRSAGPAEARWLRERERERANGRRDLIHRGGGIVPRHCSISSLLESSFRNASTAVRTLPRSAPSNSLEIVTAISSAE